MAVKLLAPLLLLLAQTACSTRLLSDTTLQARKPVRVIHNLGEWGDHAARNLSLWRANLFQATEKYILSVGNNEKPQDWDRFKLFQSVVSCPPDRPLRRVGTNGDGGKWLCEPAAEAAPCTVVSLGSRNEFGFEEAILKETACDIVTADCTVDGKVLSDRHKFLKVCIGDEANSSPERKVVTFSQMTRQLGIDKVAILKIDIEGYEYAVFGEWKETMRSLPEQIAVEVHWREQTFVPGLPTNWGRGDFGVLDLSLFFFHMANLGYGIVNQEINELCGFCSEFTLLRVEAPYSRHEAMVEELAQAARNAMRLLR